MASDARAIRGRVLPDLGQSELPDDLHGLTSAGAAAQTTSW